MKPLSVILDNTEISDGATRPSLKVDNVDGGCSWDVNKGWGSDVVGRMTPLKEFIVTTNRRDLIVVTHHVLHEGLRPVQSRAGVVVSLKNVR